MSSRTGLALRGITDQDRHRFWAKVGVVLNTGCWVWTAAMYKSGYGAFRLRNHTISAHRFAYISTKGRVPRGHELDHLCRNRACVNPGHLEPVTPGENSRRGRSWQREKAHCPKGHPYNEKNTRYWRGMRYCRECDRVRSNLRYVRRRRAVR